VLVSNRSHNVTNCQTVEVVIDKDQRTQTCGGQLCGSLGLELGRGPDAVGAGTAGLSHNSDQSAEEAEEETTAAIGDVIDFGSIKAMLGDDE